MDLDDLAHNGRPVRGNLFPYLRVSAIYDFLFCAIIMAAPILTYGILFSGVSLRFSRILMAIMLPILALRIVLRPHLVTRDRFLIFGVLPYLFYTTVSAMWSQNVDTGGVVPRLGGLYEVMILYVMCAAADLNAERFERFAKWYTLSALLPAAFGLWQLSNNILHFSPYELPFQNFLVEGKYEILTGRYFVAGSGFSRISSTFAEPVIFSNYFCSVFLLSFLVRLRSTAQRNLLWSYRMIMLVLLILAVSKLSILSLLLGLSIISFRNKEYRKLLMVALILGGCVVGTMAYFGRADVFMRLLEETGHLEKLNESLAYMEGVNLFVGAGIGSIPFGSFHRFAISRICESGIFGVIFTIAVSIIPFQVLVMKVRDERHRRIREVCVGTIFAVIFGLHAYDFFVHLFPWIVIGAIMSFYNSGKAVYRLQGT